MTAVAEAGRLAFELPPELIATAPIEASGRRRDQARLLVARRSSGRLVDAVVADLPQFLRPGDTLVVNTSATLPAALPTDDGQVLHVSTELPDGRWLVELRRRCGTGSLPFPDGVAGQIIGLPAGGRAELLAPFGPGRLSPGATRLWVASLHLEPSVAAHLGRFGRPITYGCGTTEWPLSAYQTVFATDPGSAESPSAGRPFTLELVAALVARGVVLAPVTLHTGVSSQEAGEAPYPERYRVPPETAELVNAARANGHRVIAVGTTVTRALETVADLGSGLVTGGAGWTDLVITPGRGVDVVDGIVTGWHEPEASHLQLLEAVAGRSVIEASYAHALARGYRWHEFGDLHLILP